MSVNKSQKAAGKKAKRKKVLQKKEQAKIDNGEKKLKKNVNDVNSLVADSLFDSAKSVPYSREGITVDSVVKNVMTDIILNNDLREHALTISSKKILIIERVGSTLEVGVVIKDEYLSGKRTGLQSMLNEYFQHDNSKLSIKYINGDFEPIYFAANKSLLKENATFTSKNDIRVVKPFNYWDARERFLKDVFHNDLKMKKVLLNLKSDKVYVIDGRSGSKAALPLSYFTECENLAVSGSVNEALGRNNNPSKHKVALIIDSAINFFFYSKAEILTPY